ncbi:MAG: hypothetical protein M1819_002160 [Sarea resinae]|nr:MAG: hypothetical protein M1819_002160 [Sarea resinae]
MSPRTLKVAVAGLGRMGTRHALHFLNRTPRATLVAAFSPDPAELAWAKHHLEPFGVTLYADYDEMLKHGGLEAVVISTVTTVHAEQAVKAINKDLHVLCEKPLSTSVEVSQTVVDAARSKPHLKVLCGFSRRFDASYRRAFEKTDSGAIGRPCIVRSQTCDKLDRTGFFIQYAAKSGGIFVDCQLHDVDLALWFLGQDSIPKSCTAIGIRATAPELAAHGDVDNGVAIVEFWGGKLAYFYCSRIMAAGQHDMTEIIGTEGKIAVNAAPATDLVEFHEPGGVRREIPQNYYGRFEQAFVTEANEFTAAVLDDTPLPFRLDTAVRVLEICAALQESVVSGKKIFFDEIGRRVERAQL